MILHISRMRKHVNRNVFNARKNVSATASPLARIALPALDACISWCPSALVYLCKHAMPHAGWHNDSDAVYTSTSDTESSSHIAQYILIACGVSRFVSGQPFSVIACSSFSSSAVYSWNCLYRACVTAIKLIILTMSRPISGREKSRTRTPSPKSPPLA